MTQNTVNFTGNCGECSNSGSYFQASTTAPGLQPNVQSTVTVNGQPIQNCVIGNCNAYVANVQVVAIDNPVYQYQIQVTGAGPDCWNGGSFYLAFQDETGDVYYLSIYSSTEEMHTVDYNSDSPNIVTIFWADYSFDVTSATTATPRPKAKFRVTSPAN